MKKLKSAFPSATQSCTILALTLLLQFLAAKWIFHGNLHEANFTISQSLAVITLIPLGGAIGICLIIGETRFRSFLNTDHSLKLGAELRTTLVALLLAPSLLITSATLNYLLFQLWPSAFMQRMDLKYLLENHRTALLLSTICIFSPALEEMLFRGIVLRAFIARYGRWKSIIGSSLLFATYHLNAPQFLTGLLIGLVLGWLYERTRSLSSCIALHIVYNSAVVSAHFFSENRDQHFNESEVIPIILISFALAAASMIMLKRFPPKI